MNTTIKRKLKICKTCQDPAIIFAHGNCRNCAQLLYAEKAISKKREQMTLAQTNDGLAGKPFKVNRPKQLTPVEKAFKADLNVFFASQLLVCPKECEECGTSFYGYSKEELRGLIAHILPKSPNSGFPGVACHPQNRLFLGTKCGCHNRFDNMGVEARANMKVYPTALKRFNEFAGLLTERELIKALDYLNIK